MTTTSFGLALSVHLTPKPNTVVILGSAASDWAVLIENLAQGNEEEDARIELLEAESDGSVTQAMLDKVSPLLARGFGTHVAPRLIPVGQTDDDQIKILRTIAASVKVGDVSIDVTHGLRYFGMIGFLSAHMLEQISHGLKVRNIWYGALDLTDRSTKLTPVLRLTGLLRVQSWVRALSQFDSTGDYSVFAPLLIDDGVPEDKAHCLTRAAFHEQTLNLEDAYKQLRRVMRELNRNLPGASGLFQKQLSDRLRWSVARKIDERQKILAQEHLKRHDYLRASIFALESLVNRECERIGLSATADHQRRKEVLANLRKDEDKHRKLQHQPGPLQLLCTLRNALAHSDPDIDPYSRSILRDPNRLHKELANAIEELLS